MQELTLLRHDHLPQAQRMDGTRSRARDLSGGRQSGSGRPPCPARRQPPPRRRRRCTAARRISMPRIERLWKALRRARSRAERRSARHRTSRQSGATRSFSRASPRRRDHRRRRRDARFRFRRRSRDSSRRWTDGAARTACSSPGRAGSRSRRCRLVRAYGMISSLSMPTSGLSTGTSERAPRSRHVAQRLRRHLPEALAGDERLAPSSRAMRDAIRIIMRRYSTTRSGRGAKRTISALKVAEGHHRELLASCPRGEHGRETPRLVAARCRQVRNAVEVQRIDAAPAAHHAQPRDGRIDASRQQQQHASPGRDRQAAAALDLAIERQVDRARHHVARRSPYRGA